MVWRTSSNQFWKNQLSRIWLKQETTNLATCYSAIMLFFSSLQQLMFKHFKNNVISDDQFQKRCPKMTNDSTRTLISKHKKSKKLRPQFNYEWSFSECDNFWSCCSSTNPCKDQEGDCDTNADCINDLKCGIRNCGPLYPENSDCCETEGKYS